MPLLKKIIFIVVSSLTVIQAFTQTEIEMKTNADGLFLKKQYTEATPLYLRLLSLQPKSFEYSYKYGACILFNSDNKQDAIRYLSYAVKSQPTIAEATYYLGKAYHLNYQFNDAIGQYKNYISQVGVKGEFYADAQRNIAMCENGKNLLVTLTDVIVRKKTEIKHSDFFRLYDLKDIGGSIILAVDFQSKVDKKLNHKPIVHLSPNQENVYFSSYGDGDNLDIYIARRLPGGKFGVPQKLPGSVNTNFDEDFPYLHPNGNELYFSSKGHNSMGGYDIFKSKKNQDNNQFEDVSNVDFSISSPDDDILYVVDKDNKNAFFSSTRQSKDGNIAVYKVAVERIPIQLAIVKGAFTSTILASNPKMAVEVIDKANGRKIGTFKNLKDESYLITFPKGGKYQYKVKIDGREEIYLADVEIPFLKEMRPLKQRMVHERSNEKEIVRIVNLFDEQVEDAQAIIAQVLKERANLEVNEEQYSDSDSNHDNQMNAILAEVGLPNRLPQEVAQILDQTNKLLINSSNAGSLLEQKANAVAQKLYEEIAAIDTEIRNLVKEADASQSHNRKEIILTNAVDLVKQRENKANQITQTLSEVKQLGGQTTAIEPAKIIAFDKLTTAFSQAVNENNTSSQVLLMQQNSELIKAVLSNNSPISISTELYKKQEKFDEEIARLKTIEQGYQEEKFRIENDLATLQQQLEGAKDKAKPEIKDRITEKKTVLAELNSHSEKTKKLIEASELKRTENNQRLVLINAIEHHSGKFVSKSELDQTKASISDSRAQTLKTYIETSLTTLKQSNQVASTESEVERSMETYNAASEEILMDNRLSTYERQHQLLELNEKKRAELAEKISESNNSTTLEDQQKSAQVTALQKQLHALELDQELFKQAQRAAVKEEIAKINSENIIDAIAPQFNTAKQELQANKQLTELQKLEQLNSLERDLIVKVEEEIVRIKAEKVHEKSVNQAKIDVLEKQIKATESAINTRKTQIESFEKDFISKQNAVESEVKLAALTAEIASHFTSTIEQLNTSENAEKIANLNALTASLTANKNSIQQLKSTFPLLDITSTTMDIESKIAEASMLKANYEKAEQEKAKEIELVKQKEQERVLAEQQRLADENQKNNEIAAQEKAKEIEFEKQKEQERVLAEQQRLAEEKQKNSEIAAQEKAKEIELEKQKEQERIVAEQQRLEAEKLDEFAVREVEQKIETTTISQESEISQDKIHLQTQLELESLTKKERADIQKQLNILSQKETKEDVIRMSNKAAHLDKIILSLSNSIPSEIQSLDKLINTAKNDLKQKQLLEQKIDLQEEVIHSTERQLILNANQQLSSAHPESRLITQEELVQKRRLAFIEIDELTQWKYDTESRLKSAKKEEKTTIQQVLKKIEDCSALTQEELQFYESQLKLYRKFEPAPELKSNSTTISFNEERQIAAEESYESYAKLIASKNSLLNNHMQQTKELASYQIDLKNELNSESSTSNRKDQLLQKITEKSIILKEIEQKIQALDAEIKMTLPKEPTKQMKFENLAARGINPIKKAFVATALVPISISGIEFNPTPTTVAELKKIPIEVKAPQGLVYRVQVGAFAKPIPEQHFKEFTPVTGEKIENSKITRYMAGYFNAAQAVVDAREKIRKIGYEDAFVVAYCDGKRISFAEARQLEARGECLAQQAEKIQLEVSTNIAKNVGLEDTTKAIKPVSEYTYNQAIGAAKAIAIEQFDPTKICFTVQIGVFNKPVPSERLFHLDPLYTIRLENGQIRYSVGLFGEVSEAVKQLGLVKDKVADAFVVAYYQGKRITVAQAKKLIAEGIAVYSPVNSTTKSVEQQVSSTREIEVFTNESELNTYQQKVTHYIQFSSKNTFVDYPEEELRRYNAKGDFYYDINDKRIKSSFYPSNQDLPRISAFASEIDTIQLSVEKVAELDKDPTIIKLNGTTIPGDLAYWLTFFPYRKTYNLTTSGLEIRIFDLKNAALSALKEVAISTEVSILESTTIKGERDE